jgi:exodeoxyribonuclease VII small subunit
MSPRSKKQPAGESKYEAAFAELQGIVARLESGAASLEEAMALYERGQILSKTCSALLDQAELRIRELAIPKGGKADLEELENR